MKFYHYLMALFLVFSCQKKNPNPDLCAGNNLSVSGTVEDHTITILGTGGRVPYTYSLNGETFGSSNTFENLENGTYIAYIKDYKGCIRHAEVLVEDPANSFRDARDNKLYKTVVIGNQQWISRNLDYSQMGDASLCFENNPSNCETYGRLYTYEMAQNVCPSGWHLPSEAEWDALANELGGYEGNAAKIKLEGTTGFDAKVGSGGYDPSPSTRFINSHQSHYWSSTTTSLNQEEAYIITLNSTNDIIKSYGPKTNAISVRCIKD